MCYQVIKKSTTMSIILVWVLLPLPPVLAQVIKFPSQNRAKLVTNRFSAETDDTLSTSYTPKGDTVTTVNYIDEINPRVESRKKFLLSMRHKITISKSVDDVVLVDETTKRTHRFHSRRSTVKALDGKADTVFAAIFPNNLGLANLLSQRFEEQKDWVKAIYYLKKAHREHPNSGLVDAKAFENRDGNHTYHSNLAFYLCQLRQFDKALPELNLAINCRPDSTANLKNRAKILAMMGQHELAQKDLAKLRSVNIANEEALKPKNLKILFANSQTVEYFEHDNYEGQIECQQRWITNPNKNESRISIDNLRLSMACNLLRLGRYNECLAAYKQLRSYDKLSPWIASERQRIEALSKLQPVNYSFPDVLTAKPQDTYEIGYQNNLKILTAAQIAKSHKGDVRVLKEEARQLVLAQRPKEALIELNKVMLIEPSAETHRQKLECEEAIQDWQLCVADSTAYINNLNSGKYAWENSDSAQYLFVLRARANKKLQKFENAIADLNILLKIEPDSAEVYRDRADCYTACGKYNLAIADYTKSIKFDDSKTAPNYLLRAAAYDKLGKPDLAKADRDLAAKLGSNRATKQ